MTGTALKSFFYLLVLVVSMGALTCFAQTSANVKSPGAASSEEQINRLLAEGVVALERNDTVAASKLFRQVLALKPHHAAAHTFLGVLADKAGDLASAQSHFEAAVAAEPTSPSARNNLGAVFLRRGLTKQAAEQFETSLRLNKNQSQALFNLAQIRFAAGTRADLLAAREMFEQVQTIAPDAEVARSLVVVSLRLNDREAAAKYYRQYSDQLAGNTAVGTVANRSELGAALFEAGMLPEAEAELSAAVKMSPMDQPSILRLARVYIARKDLPAAGRTLEGAVARGIETAPVYALLASVYEQSGHIENAIPAMRLAIERDPQSENYRFAYGMLLTNAMAPKAAVIRVTEAIELYPKSPRLWLGLGIAHFKAGNNAEAAKAFKRSLELDPNYAPAYAYLGMTSVEVGDYGEAVKTYERALAVNDKLGVVNYLLAEALLGLGGSNQTRIEENLKRAVQLEPSFAAARLSLGKFYFRTGRFTQAVDELEQVVKLDPQLAGAYYQLGLVYARLKRNEQAQATMATFKRLNESRRTQEREEVREIVRRLADVRF